MIRNTTARARSPPRIQSLSVKRDELRRRLDALYAHYDHRFVDPDPLQFVRAAGRPRGPGGGGPRGLRSRLRQRRADQAQHRDRARRPRPAPGAGRAPARSGGGRAPTSGLQAPLDDGRDVACLLFFLRQMLERPRLGGGVLRERPRRRSAGRRGTRPGLLLRSRPRPRPRRPLPGAPAARGRGRALLLPVAREGQRLQAPQPLPALDGAPRLAWTSASGRRCRPPPS